MHSLRCSTRLARKRVRLDEPAYSNTPMERSTKRRKTRLPQSQDEIPSPRKMEKQPETPVETLMYMPLELLHEIFQLLEPLDLVQLSYVNKKMRGVLVTRRAKHLWQMAFLNARPSPPGCPKGISLLRYALFLYGNQHHCTFCGLHASEEISELLIRFCTRCLGERLETPVLLEEEILARRVYAHYTHPITNARKFLKEELGTLRNHIQNWSRREITFRDWQRTQESALRERAQWKIKLLYWREEAEKYAAEAIIERKQRRADAITCRLRRLGYGSHIGFVGHAYYQHPQVDQAELLTEQAWTNIQHELISFLKREKQIRLDKRRQVVISQRIATLDQYLRNFSAPLSPNVILPTTLDYSQMEPLQSIIFQTPIDTYLAIQRLDGVQNQLFRLALVWQKQCADFLLNLVPAVVRGSSPSFDPSRVLELAIVFFRCKWCHDSISYPRILAHSCLRERHSRPSPLLLQSMVHYSENQRSAEPSACVANTNEQCWNHDKKQVIFAQDTCDIAKSVILALGDDPNTATAYMLNSQSQRVECLSCADDPTCSTMNWSGAVAHALEKHQDISADMLRWSLTPQVLT